MLTENAFLEHKKDYTIRTKTTVLDRYRNETNVYSDGGTIHVMWLPVTEEASIKTFGEYIKDMQEAVVYDDTPIQEHDHVVIGDRTYEFVSIKKYPSYRLVQVRKI